MQFTISITKDNGEVVSITKELNALSSTDIINSVEEQVGKIKQIVLPFLSEQLIEHHQSEFKEKKNQEEERE